MGSVPVVTPISALFLVLVTVVVGQSTQALLLQLLTSTVSSTAATTVRIFIR